MSEQHRPRSKAESILPALRARWATRRRRPRIPRDEALTRKLDAAADLIRRGIKLVVLHGTTLDGCTCEKGAGCSRPGKHPATPRGVHDATGDLSVIREALRVRSGLNLAVATGRTSGVVVLDLDRRSGGEASLAALEAALGPLPPTWMVITGNGAHLYFAYPNGIDLPTRHGRELGGGLDFQSDGAYAVTATSRHENGARYYWPRGHRPGDLPLAELPSAWVERLQSPERARPSIERSSGDSAPRRVKEGGRNNHLTKVGGHLRNAGQTGDALAAALAAINHATCEPPLPDEDVVAIAASLSRYNQNGHDGDEAEALVQAVLDEHFAGGEHLLYARDGRFWSYTGTHWQPLAGPALENLILRTLRLRPKSRLATTSLIKQAVTLLEAERSDNDDSLGFSSPPRPVINCRNGELWLDALGRVEHRPHDPRSYLRHCLDVDYDPDATCPRFDAALAEIFSRAEPIEGMVRHWWELMGYLIQPRRDIALIVIGEGEGSNGKTKLVETIQRLLGAGLVSAMRIQDLDRSRFATSDLVGKLMLVDDDVRAAVRLPDGELKKISEEKTITGERKNGPTFTFTVRTVPILLCNNPASVADLSHGMRRRLMVIPFERTFEEHEIDRGLFPAIWGEELPGVLNGALAGLGRLAERGWRFHKPAAVEAAEARWLGRANPVAAFVEERCRDGGSTPTTILYQAYLDWCTANSVTFRQQRKAFKGNLEHLGYASGRSSKSRLTVGLSLR
ncbi:hypothetical protein F8B43_1771 [Methylorubrum populi]|uniref:SF3 helicase domain-containing protein n=2 Tax=Methylorubrum populi TaxID=223967 RepID=A0A833N430_9HYPH|nr:hypothetical protein F8B43_1771 [Methylorubrum populi]